jgi:anti-anti-sigma regulatory factor
MDFKIDTRDTFSVITPADSVINTQMTDELSGVIAALGKSGSNNYIIDMSGCTGIEEDAIERLVLLHESCYSDDQSLVYTGVKGRVMAALKMNETDLLINVAPKMEEAIDIVSMEILERDLLSEDSDEI